MRKKHGFLTNDVGSSSEQGVLNLETTATGSPHRKAKAHRPLELDEISDKAGTNGLGKAIRKKARVNSEKKYVYPYNIEEQGKLEATA